MNKTSIGIGAVMLVAAAAFIYFEEPLIARIASGAVFLVGAMLLYRSIAATVGDGEEEQDAQGEQEDKPGDHADAGRHLRGDARRGTHSMETTGIPGGKETDADNTAERNPSAVAEGTRGRDSHAAHSLRAGIPSSAVPVSEIPPELYLHPLPQLPADDPRAEFDYLVRQLLYVLKEHLLAHTAALFWINRDREQVIIGELATDSVSFTTARRLPLGTDLVSKVGLSGRPEIHADIPSQAERDLLTYYDAPEGVRSFVGVPLIFAEEVVAVLAADSKPRDSFGLETVATIGRFCSLVTTLLASYNQKFDLAADARMLHTIDRMRDSLDGVMDRAGVVASALDAATAVMDWDFASVILYSPERQAWIVETSRARASAMAYISEGVTVDMDGSVLRVALEGSSPRVLDAPAAPSYRFHEKEAVAGSGELIAAPVISHHRVHGLIVIEYREKHQYGPQDSQALLRIAGITGTALETVRLLALTRDRLIVDEQTLMLSRPLLLRRLGEEQARIRDAGGTAVFLIISLDRRDEFVDRHGEAEAAQVLRLAGNAVAEFLRPYDILGRYDVGSFGLVLTGTGTEDAYLKAEKLRKAIAATVVPGNSGNYSITVSIAGCTLSPSSDIDHVRRIAAQALDRATSDGGNCVKVV